MTASPALRRLMPNLAAALACLLLATPALAYETLAFGYTQIRHPYSKVPFTRPLATLDAETRTLILEGTDDDDLIALAFTDDGTPLTRSGHFFEGCLLTASSTRGGDGGTVDGADFLVWQRQLGTWDDVVIDGRIITAEAFDRVVVFGGAGRDILIGGRGQDVDLDGGQGFDVLVYDDLGDLDVQLAVLGEPAGDGDIVLTNGEGPGGGWPTSQGQTRDAYFVKADAETTTQSGGGDPGAQAVLDQWASAPNESPSTIDLLMVAGEDGNQLVIQSPLWTVTGSELDPDVDVELDLVDGQVQTSATIELEPVLITSYSSSSAHD